MNELLIKRVKSLLWRALMMGLAIFCTVLAENVASVGIPAGYTVVLGLIFGELSKFLNSKAS